MGNREPQQVKASAQSEQWNTVFTALNKALSDITNAKSLQDVVFVNLGSSLRKIEDINKKNGVRNSNSDEWKFLNQTILDLNKFVSNDLDQNNKKYLYEAKEYLLERVQLAKGNVTPAEDSKKDGFVPQRAEPMPIGSLAAKAKEWETNYENLMEKHKEANKNIGEGKLILIEKEIDAGNDVKVLVRSFLDIVSEDPINVNNAAKTASSVVKNFRELKADFDSNLPGDVTGVYKEAARQFKGITGMTLDDAATLVARFEAVQTQLLTVEYYAPFMTSHSVLSSALVYADLADALDKSNKNLRGEEDAETIISALKTVRERMTGGTTEAHTTSVHAIDDVIKELEGDGSISDKKGKLEALHEQAMSWKGEATGSLDYSILLTAVVYADLADALDKSGKNLRKEEDAKTIISALKTVRERMTEGTTEAHTTSVHAIDDVIKELDGNGSISEKKEKLGALYDQAMSWKGEAAGKLNSDMQTYYNVRAKLLEDTAGPGGFTNHDIYLTVSAAYADTDVIRSNEKIMANEKFVHEQNLLRNFREYRSDVLLSMDLRSQFAFLFSTKPALVGANKWTYDGLKEQENIAIALDSRLAAFSAQQAGTLIASSNANNFRDLTSSSFKSDFPQGGGTTVIKVTLANDTTEEITGAVVKPDPAGKPDKYQIGDLSINFFNGQCQIGSGSTAKKFTLPGYSVSDAEYSLAKGVQYVPPGAVSTPAAPVAASDSGLGTLLAKKIDLSQKFPSMMENFWGNAGPVLALYDNPLSVVNTLIVPSMEKILLGWDTRDDQTGLTIGTDYTAGRRELREFNKELRDLLVPSMAKEIAESEIRRPGLEDNFALDPSMGRRYDRVSQSLIREQKVLPIPYGNIVIRGIPYIRPPGPEARWIMPGNVQRIFGDPWADLVQLTGAPNVQISAIKYEMSPSVIAAVGNAIPSHLYSGTPKTFLRRQDLKLVAGGTTAWVEKIKEGEATVSTKSFGNDITLNYSRLEGKNTLYNARFTETIVGGDNIKSNHLRKFNFRMVNVPLGDYMTPLIQTDVEMHNSLVTRALGFASIVTPARHVLKIDKDNTTNTFSIKYGYRSPTGNFQGKTIVQNATVAEMEEIFSKIQWNSGTFAPTIAFKGQTELPRGAADIIDRIKDTRFAGMLIATNFGPNFGVAYIENAIPGSPNAPADSGPTDPLIMTHGRGVSLSRKKILVQSERALSAFFRASETWGLYAHAMDSKVAGSGKSRVNEVEVTSVWNDQGSISASVNRFSPGPGDFEAYSAEGKIRLNPTTKVGGMGFWGVNDITPWGNTADKPKYIKVAGGSFVATEDSKQAFAALSILYNTEGKLWTYQPDDAKQGEGNMNLAARASSVRFENYLRIAEEKKNIDNTSSGGAAADIEVPAFGGRLTAQGAADYGTKTNVAGIHLTQLSLSEDGKKMLSVGLMGGKSKNVLKEDRTLFAAGVRLKGVPGWSPAGLSFDNLTWALQSTFMNNPDEWSGLFGLNIKDDGKKLNFSSVYSWLTQGDAYTLGTMYNELRYKQLGAFIAIEGEEQKKATIYTSMKINTAKKYAMLGNLYYMDPNGRFKVYGELKKLNQDIDGGERHDTEMKIGVAYLRIPGDRPLLGLANLDFSLSYDLFELKPKGQTYWSGGNDWKLMLGLTLVPF